MKDEYRCGNCCACTEGDEGGVRCGVHVIYDCRKVVPNHNCKEGIKILKSNSIKSAVVEGKEYVCFTQDEAKAFLGWFVGVDPQFIKIDDWIKMVPYEKE